MTTMKNKKKNEVMDYIIAFLVGGRSIFFKTRRIFFFFGIEKNLADALPRECI